MIDSRDITDRYLPIMYPEEEPFWEGTAVEELRLQRCGECQRVRYPIGPVCPNCLSDRYSWDVMSGQGTVQTFAVFHHGWAPWMERRLPYVVAQVELIEGPRLTTNILGIPPEQVRINLEVSACYERISNDIVLVQFSPVGIDPQVL